MPDTNDEGYVITEEEAAAEDDTEWELKEWED